jgi:hypothetical protein
LSKKYWTGVTFDEDFAPNALTLYKGKAPEALLGKRRGSLLQQKRQLQGVLNYPGRPKAYQAET